MNNNPLTYTIKTILVPTDFSGSAKNALKYAIAIAKRVNARILLLHVYNIPLVPSRTPYVLNIDSVRDNIKSAETQLESLESEVAELKTVTYETKTTPGYGIIEISEIIQSQNVDLIVMGTKGASGLKEIILGSNTANVIEKATCPVLAIPEQVSYKEIKHIGFAYDNQTLPPKIELLIAFAKIFNAAVQVFHIKEQSENCESEETTSGNLLTMYFRDISYEYTSFHNENLEKGINKYINLKSIDIITLIPRKHNLFYRLFKSSLTKKMAFHSLIPLLTIPEE